MSVSVLYNATYGGFSLSESACEYLFNTYGINYSYLHGMGMLKESIARHDKRLLDVVDKLGIENVGGKYTKLRIKELTGDRYMIDEYDGWETVIEPHDQEWIIVNDE